MPESLETVLRMVEEGRLSAEEAAGLLAALDDAGAPPDRGPRDAASGASTADPETPKAESGRGRVVRVEVTDNGRVVVNLKLPASLGELAMSRVPGLGEGELSRIREALLTGLRGDIVRVLDDDGSGVRIAVE
jgi:hypothetical protein